MLIVKLLVVSFVQTRWCLKTDLKHLKWFPGIPFCATSYYLQNSMKWKSILHSSSLSTKKTQEGKQYSSESWDQVLWEEPRCKDNNKRTRTSRYLVILEKQQQQVKMKIPLVTVMTCREMPFHGHTYVLPKITR